KNHNPCAVKCWHISKIEVMATSYKLLKTYGFLHKADLDLIKLRSEGIEAYMADSNTVTVAPYYAQAIGGIKIYVVEHDFEQACKMLSKDQTEDENLREIFKGEELEP